MTYAVIQTGGKQYKVKASEILKIEKLENSKPESKIEFKEILAYGDDKTIEVGAPFVDGAKVEAKLIKINKIFSKDGNVISEIKKTVSPTKKIVKKEVQKKNK